MKLYDLLLTIDREKIISDIKRDAILAGEPLPTDEELNGFYDQALAVMKDELAKFDGDINPLEATDEEIDFIEGIEISNDEINAAYDKLVGGDSGS